MLARVLYLKSSKTTPLFPQRRERGGSDEGLPVSYVPKKRIETKRLNSHRVPCLCGVFGSRCVFETTGSTRATIRIGVGKARNWSCDESGVKLGISTH